MVSEKSLLEILKRISTNTWAVVAFFILGISLALATFAKQKWMDIPILSIEASYWLHLIDIISGVFVVICFVIELRKEAKIAPFKELLEKYNLSNDQLDDLKKFLDGKRNIMNHTQLAAQQLKVMNIIVIAPQPLELTSQRVLESTLNWLEAHIGDENAFIEYWSTNRFDDNLPALSVISRLVAMAGNKDILQRIRCVTVLDELLFIDFTVWVFRNNNIMVFANDKGAEEQEYLLWQLYWKTVMTMYELLNTIKQNGVVSDLQIPCVTKDAPPYSIKRTHITHVPHDAIEKLRNVSKK